MQRRCLCKCFRRIAVDSAVDDYVQLFEWAGFTCVIPVCLDVSSCLFGVTPYCIYSGRSFILDARGWTISSGRYQKTYFWDEVTVPYCKNDHGISLDDWIRPGILLTASPLKKPSKLNAMPACIFYHPLISVFLRFRTDDTNYIAANITYEGYVVEKEELLAFIIENNITIKDSHLI